MDVEKEAAVAVSAILYYLPTKKAKPEKKKFFLVISLSSEVCQSILLGQSDIEGCR
jgi:hypothetical protein